MIIKHYLVIHKATRHYFTKKSNALSFAEFQSQFDSTHVLQGTWAFDSFNPRSGINTYAKQFDGVYHVESLYPDEED